MVPLKANNKFGKLDKIDINGKIYDYFGQMDE